MALVVFLRIMIFWLLGLVSQGHGATTVTPSDLAIATSQPSTLAPPSAPASAGQTEKATTTSSTDTINATSTAGSDVSTTVPSLQGDVMAAGLPSGDAATGSQTAQTSATINSSLTDASPGNSSIQSDVATFPALETLLAFLLPSEAGGNATSSQRSDLTIQSSQGSQGSDLTTQSSQGSQGSDLTIQSSQGSQGSDLTTQSSQGSQGSDMTTQSSQGSQSSDMTTPSSQGSQGAWTDTQGPVMLPFQDIPISDQTAVSTSSPNQTQDNVTLAQPSLCDVVSAGRCLQAGLQDLSQSLFFLLVFRNPRITVPYFCGKFSARRTCLQKHLQACTSQQRLRYDVILAGTDFLCSPQGTEVLADALPCLQSTQTGPGLARCLVAGQPALRQGDMCSMMVAYTDCSSQVFAACSTPAASGIRKLMHSTFAPFRLVSGCPEGQTTQPPITTPRPSTVSVIAATAAAGLPSLPPGTLMPPTPSSASQPGLQLKCYECSSGATGRLFNEFCAPDGDVSRRYLGTYPCRAPCYARVQKNLFGVTYIQRGCATGMESSFPGGIPTSGCRQTPGGTTCFCSNRNGCNMQDMEPYTDLP